MINKKLLQEIEKYCELNGFVDIEKKINEMLRIGFNIERYGDSPFYERKLEKEEVFEEKKENIIEKEIIEVKKDKPKRKVRIIKNK